MWHKHHPGNVQVIGKHLKEGGSFAWHCPECPSTSDHSLDESAAIESPMDAFSTAADNSFTVDLPIDPVIPIQEESLEDEPIPENLPDDRPATWEVVPSGTR